MLKKLKKRIRSYLQFLDSRILEFILFFTPKLMPKMFITCIRNDGGGAQIHGRISVMALCERFGLKFTNSQINGAHFSDGDEWDKKWNALFAFGGDTELSMGNSRRIKATDTPQLWKKLIMTMLALKFRKPLIIEMESAHTYTNRNPDLLERLRPRLKEFFQPTLYQYSEEIVIHLRRGDDLTADIRLESNESLSKRLISLRQNYPHFEVRIYTNAPLEIPKEFAYFVRVDWHTSPFDAISHMANSEVLVIAKSSMSYIAGLASNNVVYAPTFWHPRLKHWKDAESLEKV